MRVKALGDILGMPKNARGAVLAKGLELLAEQVLAIRDDVEYLVAGERSRSAAILNVVGAEEAAKILMILDLARLGWRDQLAAKRLIDEMSLHLARGIYVEVADANIASVPELRQYVEWLRVSHYLDGPNDVDWVFRNQIETRREETLYVDYVVDDDGPRWVTPRDDVELIPVRGAARVFELIEALKRTGLLSELGLALITSTWSKVRVVDDTHWSEIERLNREVIQRAWEAGLQDPNTARRDGYTIINRWSFPLFDFDLRRRNVPQSELDARRSRAFEQMNDDWSDAPDTDW